MENKNKKKKKIVIILIIILIAIVLSWFLFLRDFLSDELNISPDNLFPFGNPSQREPEPTPTEPGNQSGGPLRPDEFQPLFRNRLRLISNRDTSNFVPIVTDIFYPTQNSIVTYNEARGEIPIDTLAVLRAPKIRINERTSGHIYDIRQGTSVTEEQVSSTQIPDIGESFFNQNGDILVARRYDRRSSLIETFVGEVPETNNQLTCEIPVDRSFSFGDTHPGIAGTKNALAGLYGYTIEPGDVFDESLGLAMTTFIENMDLLQDSTSTADALSSTSTITSLNLQELKNICEEAKNREIATRSSLMSGDFISANIDTALLNTDGPELLTIRKKTPVEPYHIESYHTVFQTNKTILSTEFGEWIGHWINNDLVILQTKPSNEVAGYAYILDTQTGRFDKILGDKLGLLVLVSPDGTHILYSANTGNRQTRTRLYNIQSKKETSLPFSTLADKCTWSTDSSQVFCAAPINGLGVGEPDQWFQGKSTYSDQFWYTNTVDAQSFRLYDPIRENNQNLDVTSLQYDPFEGNYLYFIDKNTGRPWSLEIDGIDGRLE